ncbi:PLP-dependent aminotransferase family protein [Tepidiforma sp.]|uniref:MocR-like pyridoxine biosynthesis transcription factor PdxR n=1 Tax=Tepidiforma sp. TaxID=2682230 RepID=UPI002ADE7ACF|nr:PLP-dependent aminotransferase family protein [Tepidiforma sp.]
MDIVIDLPEDPGLPAYRRLAAGLRQAITDGRIRPGERLPPTRVLARTLGMARNTVLDAYDQLTSEGYLVARHGSGTFVAPEIPDRAFEAGPAKAVQARAAVPARLDLSSAGRRLRDAGLTGMSAAIRDAPLRWDFRYGTPSFAEFPLADWRSLTRRVLDYPAPELLGYGHPGGFPALREALARYLQRSRGVRCTPDSLLVVSGSQQALDLTARLLLDPGDVVAIEEPGYPGARAAFAGVGAELAPVPVDDEGMRVDLIPAPAKLIYVTPSHQFPTGAVMSAPRRLALLERARQLNALIIEDDYDSEFRYESRPLAALQGLDSAGRVIYTGTMSKVLLPALRLGYVVPPPQLADAFTAAKWVTDRHASLLTQAVLALFLSEGHFARHLRRMRKVYARRRAVLIAALREHFSRTASIGGTESGIHLMVTLHGMRNGEALANAAREAGVGIYPATGYYLGPPPAEASFVIGYSSVDERDIAAGIAALAHVVQQFAG